MNFVNNPLWKSIDALSTPFLIISANYPNSTILATNRAATKQFNAFLEGINFFELLDCSPITLAELAKYFKVGDNRDIYSIQKVRIKESALDLSINISPIIDEGSKDRCYLIQIIQVFYFNQEKLNDSLEGINSRLLIEMRDRNFKSIIQQAPVGICLINSDDLTILNWNEQFQETIGRDINFESGQTIWDIVPEVADTYKPIMDRVIETGISYVAKEHEVILNKRNVLTNVISDFVFEPIKNANQRVRTIMIVSIDVTDKVLARRKIEDVEERIRLAVDAADIGTFEYNYNENCTISSDRANQILGFEGSFTTEDILKKLHPQDVQVRDAAHIQARIDGKLNYEARVLGKDGHYKWVRIQAQLYLNEDKSPSRLLGTVLDITEFKRLQQQKEDFVSIASHELKTPITSLKASLQLLEKFKAELNSPVVLRLIDQCSKSMGKISKLVDDLLNVSRMNVGQVPLNKHTFNIQDLIEEVAKSFSLSSSIKISIKGETKVNVFADEHRIDQVITNFINNALKHSLTSTEITILSELTDDGFVKVSIIDNGAGIEEDKLPYLFDRYYQGNFTQAGFSGLGLGLFISAEIIQRHKGKIGVESKFGKGSTFWFTIPVGKSVI